MRSFIWQAAAWPHLKADAGALLPAISDARSKQHHLLGALSLAGRDERTEATVNALSASAVETSKIEGETLEPNSVRASVARRLGVDKGGAIQDDRTEGVVEMTLDAVREFAQPLTKERLCMWHAGLFPATVDRPASLSAARYRLPAEDPMRVVSGAAGRERIHFEAPPGADVPKMMSVFLRWFNSSAGNENGLIRAAKAHLWFLTIHPFYDGNGRIGRAIADMALAQDEGSRDRFYSLSAQIQRERDAYYDALESAQRGTLDITRWVLWFAGCLTRSIEASEKVVTRARAAARFWNTHKERALNERQKRVLWRLLGDFEGALNLRKYIAITQASEATAQRDLSDLVDAGILTIAGKARATHYLLSGTTDRT